MLTMTMMALLIVRIAIEITRLELGCPGIITVVFVTMIVFVVVVVVMVMVVVMVVVLVVEVGAVTVTITESSTGLQTAAQKLDISGHLVIWA